MIKVNQNVLFYNDDTGQLDYDVFKVTRIHQTKNGFLYDIESLSSDPFGYPVDFRYVPRENLTPIDLNSILQNAERLS